MKRTTPAVVLLAALTLAGALAAWAASPEAAAKPVTLRGEIVDMGCYIGHEARGEKHRSCATKCIAGGMPMGLLTADNTLYLITLSHEDAAPYSAAKTLAGTMVEASGTVSTRGGVKALDLTAIKAAK
jgi:hypothetical protein